jgi:UPF0271 protein|tara:strand:+ start:369 stop:1079 length:711 start_codon:yes stop_codon:yes gene_type:complete
MNKSFHINADIGEGFGIEAEMMPLIDSCNIACGGHAGSKEEISKAIALAEKNDVKIGAHPSYPDLENFGRISMEINLDELYKSIKQQMILFLNESSYTLNHVKAHGALYHDSANKPKIASILIKVILELCPHAIIVTLPNSILEKLGKENNLTIWREGFIDRRYHDNGQLVSRANPSATLSTLEDLNQQFYTLINHQYVKTLEGNTLSLKVDTLCIHGDHPNSVRNLKSLMISFKQ